MGNGDSVDAKFRGDINVELTAMINGATTE